MLRIFWVYEQATCLFKIEYFSLQNNSKVTYFGNIKLNWGTDSIKSFPDSLFFEIRGLLLTLVLSTKQQINSVDGQGFTMDGSLFLHSKDCVEVSGTRVSKSVIKSVLAWSWMVAKMVDRP